MAKQISGTEIVGKLRQADVQLAQGKTVPEVCRELGISQQTYYRWRNKCGGMSVWIVNYSSGWKSCVTSVKNIGWIITTTGRI
ncbi:MAG TPA: helix-turn-helix domain-containing protein, partial [Anaerohalosphaeraceae bacterium]|nr:helix-turn-helix domain-containing protein [Anaerohalosphaeraceae bacterium]HOM76863.1 helix-turn-helix domain-containing protein [Anaerohalosphaeraceae bacterium]HPC65258.1 helix-turn-helix domain-containing protein [Anaerohalosphaeraceae bacterium]HPO70588.1 helix-turn-helix domain-containing protein [Anaerohalosphaeraceae bacterium]HRV21162.1 helix-turn-helix domain-containing protein [Anaerohalosphaeraceae bacterium]